MTDSQTVRSKPPRASGNPSGWKVLGFLAVTLIFSPAFTLWDLLRGKAGMERLRLLWPMHVVGYVITALFWIVSFAMQPHHAPYQPTFEEQVRAGMAGICERKLADPNHATSC